MGNNEYDKFFNKVLEKFIEELRFDFHKKENFGFKEIYVNFNKFVNSQDDYILFKQSLDKMVQDYDNELKFFKAMIDELEQLRK